MVRQASESELCVGTLGALLGRFHVRAADETDKALKGSLRKTLMRKQACAIPKKGMDASSRVDGFIELTNSDLLQGSNFAFYRLYDPALDLWGFSGD